MRLVVDGFEIFAGTGGRAFDPALPLVVFVHGAALDQAWADRTFELFILGVIASPWAVNVLVGATATR